MCTAIIALLPHGDGVRIGSNASVEQRSLFVCWTPSQLTEWCTAANWRSVPEPDSCSAGTRVKPRHQPRALVMPPPRTMSTLAISMIASVAGSTPV